MYIINRLFIHFPMTFCFSYAKSNNTLQGLKGNGNNPAKWNRFQSIFFTLLVSRCLSGMTATVRSSIEAFRHPLHNFAETVVTQNNLTLAKHLKVCP